MGDNSWIEWTDATWNCIRGCSLVSGGCKYCYAMKQAHRFSGPGGAYEGLTELGPEGPRWTGKVRTVPQLLELPLHWKKPRRVFVNSMSDLFHEDVPHEFIRDVFSVMIRCEWHTFQVLTKRPKRMQEIVQRWYPKNRAYPPNVWLGVSVEDQKTADERIPLLLQTPAAVRFVSAEPLIGPIDLTKWLVGETSNDGGRESISGVSSDRRVFDRRTREDLETSTPDRRQPHGDAAVLENLGSSSTGGGVRVGRLSDGDVFRQNDPSQNLRASRGMDACLSSRHSGGNAGQSQERHSHGLRSSESGVDDAIGEHNSRNPGPRPETQGSERRTERERKTDSGTGDEDSRSRRQDGPISNSADVRREAKHDIGNLSAQELGAHSITWVIIGGESGNGARPFDIGWARSVIRQCRDSRVACFLKQVGRDPVMRKDNGCMEDWPAYTRGEIVGDFLHFRLEDGKGGDMSEWADDLRVRQYPTVKGLSA
jgi:protein gp37